MLASNSPLFIHADRGDASGAGSFCFREGKKHQHPHPPTPRTKHASKKHFYHVEEIRRKQCDRAAGTEGSESTREKLVRARV